jgi:DNA modification methylase
MRPPMPLILRGDACRLPIPDESVDLICCSPPYFGLRSYTDGGEHYDGQIGAEPTPREFIAALVDCTREMVRVLKPSGSIFLNLGDKYSDRTGGKTSGRGTGRGPQAGRLPGTRGPLEKSLLLLPERYRIACVDELGLIARAVICWSKPNGLPESVTDRVRRSHEDWVHLVRSPRYFSAVDEIREPHSPESLRLQRQARERPRGAERRHAVGNYLPGDASGLGTGRKDVNPLGKLPGSVWEIATQPLRVPAELGVDHFAAFPMEWPRRLILGWSPREVCTACGEGRRPVAERVTGLSLDGRKRPARDSAVNWSETECADNKWGGDRSFARGVGARIVGYACACPDTTAPSTPGVVVDPFGGTGTTALVAAMHGRRGISVDLSADYCRLAEWRANDPKERARAAGLDPDAIAAVKPQLPGQIDLFGTAS